MSSLYPEMRFSWEIRSVDALFCNGMTRVGDLSREAILSSIRDEQVSLKKGYVEIYRDISKYSFKSHQLSSSCFCCITGLIGPSR